MVGFNRLVSISSISYIHYQQLSSTKLINTQPVADEWQKVWRSNVHRAGGFALQFSTTLPSLEPNIALQDEKGVFLCWTASSTDKPQVNPIFLATDQWASPFKKTKGLARSAFQQYIGVVLTCLDDKHSQNDCQQVWDNKCSMVEMILSTKSSASGHRDLACFSAVILAEANSACTPCLLVKPHAICTFFLVSPC